MRSAKITLLFTACAILASCTQDTPKSQIPDTEDSIANRRSSLTQDSLIDSGMPCGDYLSDYADDIRSDTVVRVNGTTTRVSHFTDTKKRISIPPTLLFSCNEQFVFDGYIKISNNAVPNKELVIDRKLYTKYLMKENIYVRKYGVPLSVSVSVDSVKNTMGIQFSLSIPYTDLGEAVIIYVEPKKLTIIPTAIND